MNRGAARQPIFRDDADRREFLRLVAALHRDFGVTVLAYCLMGNHFHLLLRAPPGVLSEAMQHLSSVYTRRFNDRHGRDGPLFRGRFQSIPVDTDTYLLWVTRYIHRNALDLPGVRSLGEYGWSSYGAYLGLWPPPSFLDLGLVMGMFGWRTDEVVAFTEGDDRSGCARARGRPEAWPADAVDVWSTAACAVAVDDLVHGEHESSRQGAERSLVVLLTRRCPDPQLVADLQASLGHPTSQALRSAASRAEARLRSDEALARMLRWAQRELASRPSWLVVEAAVSKGV